MPSRLPFQLLFKGPRKAGFSRRFQRGLERGLEKGGLLKDASRGLLTVNLLPPPRQGASQAPFKKPPFSSPPSPNYDGPCPEHIPVAVAAVEISKCCEKLTLLLCVAQ